MCVRCRLRAVLGRDAGRDGRLRRLRSPQAGRAGPRRGRAGPRRRRAGPRRVASRPPAARRQAARAIRSAPVARKRSVPAVTPARVGRRAAPAGPQGRPVGAGLLGPAAAPAGRRPRLARPARFVRGLRDLRRDGAAQWKMDGQDERHGDRGGRRHARAQRGEGGSLPQLAGEQRPARLHSHARRAGFPGRRGQAVRPLHDVHRPIHVGRGHQHSQQDRLGRRCVHPGVWRKRPGLCFRHVQRHRGRTPRRIPARASSATRASTSTMRPGKASGSASNSRSTTRAAFRPANNRAAPPCPTSGRRGRS